MCVYVHVCHQLWRVVVGHGEWRPAGDGGEPGARALGRGGGRTQPQPCRLLGTCARRAGGSHSSRQAPRLHFDVKSSNLRCGDYLGLFSSGNEPGPELAAVSLAALLSRGLFSPPRSSLALSPRPCSRSQDFLPAALGISLPSSSLVVRKTGASNDVRHRRLPGRDQWGPGLHATGRLGNRAAPGWWRLALAYTGMASSSSSRVTPCGTSSE